MKWFRALGMAAMAVGIVLLAIGWSVGIDFLGFLFMVFTVTGVALLISDFVVRRRTRVSPR